MRIKYLFTLVKPAVDKSRGGFTLMETLVVVSIFLILTLAAYTVVDVGTKTWFINGASSGLRQEIIRAFMRMGREIKGTNPGQVSLSIGNSNSTFIFKVPQDRDMDGTNLDSEGNIEWSDDITYALDLGAKRITRTALNVTAALANDIVDLRFSRPVASSSRLQIDITARKTFATGREIQEAGQIIIKMRN